MGCSSSTATGALEPTQKCYDYSALLKLCNGPVGSYGCFVKKDRLKLFTKIILEKYDLLVQYPTVLANIKRPTEAEAERKKIGKTIKHTELLLTDKSKEDFLNALFKRRSITGLKVFFKQFTGSNRTMDNTFNRECLRLREQMNNFVLEHKEGEPQYNVRSVQFTPDVHSSYRKKLSDIGLTGKDLTTEYISFSLKIKSDVGDIQERQLKRIDFIFLELCEEGNLDYYKFTTTAELNKFIKTVITDLHSLHRQNIFHLDIKPGNMIKCGNRYKLIDYGTSVGLPTKSSDQTKLREYLQEIFKEIVGTPEYYNPIYKMVANSIPDPTGLDLGKVYNINKLNNIEKAWVQKYYSKYIIEVTDGTTTLILFLLEYFIFNHEKENLKMFYTFVKHFYSRADWYSLAITLDKIISKFVSDMFITEHPIVGKPYNNYKNGVQKLSDISDEELDSDNLHKTLINAFGLRQSFSPNSQ